MFWSLLRYGLLVAFVSGAVAAASDGAKSDTKWLDNAEHASKKAAQVDLPILFYLSPSSDGPAHAVQQPAQSFSDEGVARLVNERFIPAQLRPSTTTSIVLKQLKAVDEVPGSVVVATPEGKLVGVISPGDVGQTDRLRARLMELFQQYRANLYDARLKTIIEDDKSKSADVLRALELVSHLSISEADKGVIALASRKDLPKDVRARALKTLATLSTRPSVEFLLEQAMQDEAAAGALRTCTPSGVEALLPVLESAREQQLVIAYEAVMQICQVPDPKPRKFWATAAVAARTAEIDRVKQAVAKCAADWRAQHPLQ